MVAAYCEVLRAMRDRLAVTPPLLAAALLREAQQFHYRLIMELIDDSEGEHVFTEAHLESLYERLRARPDISEADRPAFEDLLKDYADHRNDY